MSEEHGFKIRLEQVEEFEFKVKFDWEETAELLLDEPEPLGRRRGPNASRVLAAAVGHCLTASLLFCARKARVDFKGLTTEVSGRILRNERGRFRVRGMDVEIRLPEGTETPEAGVERCLKLFEDYCIVTESVRHGIPVRVEVIDSSGRRLHVGGGE